MKHFWNILCKDKGHKLFVGKVFEDLDFIYNSMSPDFLHFIPTINNSIAVNISNGVIFSGNDVCLLIKSDFLSEYNNIILPMLIITDNGSDFKNVKGFEYCGVNSIHTVEEYIIEKNKPAAIIFNDKF